MSFFKNLFKKDKDKKEKEELIQEENQIQEEEAIQQEPELDNDREEDNITPFFEPETEQETKLQNSPEVDDEWPRNKEEVEVENASDMLESVVEKEEETLAEKDSIQQSFENEDKTEVIDKKEDLNKGLKKSNDSIFSKLSKVVAGKTTIDDDVLDDIEEALVSSDISVDTVIKIIERLEKRAASDKYLNIEEVYDMLKDEIIEMLTENNTPDYTDFNVPVTKANCPYVILIVGVNGAGKTTTIGKLSYQFGKLGKKVILGAADTFRAAAVDQLTIWSERVGVDIISQGMDADPAAVAFDTVNAGVARNADVIMIDTAGRLHNKKHLMDELSKIKRVMKKVDSDFPHEVLLIVDGSTGQNALLQAKEFIKATEVTAIAVTKLDGTAKGGAVIAIADQFKIPIKYIGVGEGIEHLQVFNKKDYVDSLFKR